jgi:hypothetical protein
MAHVTVRTAHKDGQLQSKLLLNLKHTRHGHDAARRCAAQSQQAGVEWLVLLRGAVRAALSP